MLPIIVSAFLAGGVGLVVIGALSARHPAADGADYLRALADGDLPADPFDAQLAQPFARRVLAPVVGAATRLGGSFLPAAHRDRVEHQLELAGLRGSIGVEEFLVVQILCAVLGAALGIGYAVYGGGSARVGLAVAALCVAAGVLAPRSWLSRKVAERREAIFLDLPDILDLMAISVEAGVGFEGAMEIVCSHFESPLALEFSRTLKEMELGLPRREALQNLKRRTEVPELSNFVLALVQADALGMPIGRVLHTQATEMRMRRRQWAREKAGKLPVKILFPLVLFIFPPVMIVILGPAAATIGRSFH